MPIIRPAGLLSGERMNELSDTARLYWAFLYAASNGYGRFELDYQKILESAFRQFRQKPTQDEVRALIREYRDKYLLFIYKANGRLWCAWDDAANQQYFNARDKASPAPPEPAFSDWRNQYRATKVLRTDQLSDLEREFDSEAKECSLSFNIESISSQQRVNNESIANLHNTNTITQLSTQLNTTQNTAQTSTRAHERNGRELPLAPSDAPSAEEVREFSDWCEQRYAKHPKKIDKFLSMKSLQSHFCRDPDARALFDRNHDLFCETEAWCEKNGNFAPKLWEFIENDGWKYPPIQPSKQQNGKGRGMMQDLLG